MAIFIISHVDMRAREYSDDHEYRDGDALILRSEFIRPSVIVHSSIHMPRPFIFRLPSFLLLFFFLSFFVIFSSLLLRFLLPSIFRFFDSLLRPFLLHFHHRLLMLRARKRCARLWRYSCYRRAVEAIPSYRLMLHRMRHCHQRAYYCPVLWGRLPACYFT